MSFFLCMVSVFDFLNCNNHSILIFYYQHGSIFKNMDTHLTLPVNIINVPDSKTQMRTGSHMTCLLHMPSRQMLMVVCSPPLVVQLLHRFTPDSYVTNSIIITSKCLTMFTCLWLGSHYGSLAKYSKKFMQSPGPPQAIKLSQCQAAAVATAFKIYIQHAFL